MPFFVYAIFHLLKAAWLEVSKMQQKHIKYAYLRALCYIRVTQTITR